MTIIQTPEMRAMWSEIKPYLVWDKNELVFKKNTPKRIIELNKKHTELWKEEERKTIELDEYGWGN